MTSTWTSTSSRPGDGPNRPVHVTYSSDLLAHLAALVRTRRAGLRRVGLDVVGEPFVMPPTRATEGSGLAYASDPFQWNMYAGRSRMVEAWQLVDSFRQVKGGAPVWVAICDTQFWLDVAGRPQVAPGQTRSDFGQGVLQWNLLNEGQPAGILSSTSALPFHGNRVASAALAAIGDRAGAAGSGGLVARPALFLGANRASDATRAIELCVWWGVDVLNMSLGFLEPRQRRVRRGHPASRSSTGEPTTGWCASLPPARGAATQLSNLPDGLDVRPATRTPRTLTVGALDTNRPGVRALQLRLVGQPVGARYRHTGRPGCGSARRHHGERDLVRALHSSPGVAAMMRFCNPGLSADDVRRLLVETGWQGAGRVSRGLDAAAAVRAALNSRLPDTHEDNKLAEARIPAPSYRARAERSRWADSVHCRPPRRPIATTGPSTSPTSAMWVLTIPSGTPSWRGSRSSWRARRR